MSRRRCCCGCKTFRDLFDREDAIDLGPNWPEYVEDDTILAQTGDWSIDDLQAVELDGAGRAIYKHKHPVPDESMIVAIDIPDMQLGDFYEVLLNWKDFDNFHYAQIEITAVDALTGIAWVTLRLRSVAAGVDSLIKELEIGRVYPNGDGKCTGTLTAKIGDEGFCADLSSADIHTVWETATVIPEGYYAGMGTAGRSGMAIDAWAWSEHLETNPDCPWCVCKCGNKPIPKKLVATIVDCTGRMVGAEGCEIDLDWQQPTLISTPSFPGWYGWKNCCGGMDVHFMCGEDGTVGSMQATVPTTCNTLAESLFAAAGSTCDPLNLRFGPFHAGSSDLVCGCGTPMVDPDGEFYVVITE